MRLHDRIVQGLTEDIVLGDVAAGAWLPRELDLMDRHGVSRGVVREAIRALESRRLVEVRHGRGARVRPEAEWDLLDAGVLEAFLLRPDRTAMVAELLECRRLLEGQAAAQAAARATGEDVQALSDAHAALAAVTVAPRRPSTAEAFVEAEADVHRVVVRLAGNRPLERMLAPLHPALATAIRDQPPERHVVLLDVLERLLEAIRTRDGDAARAAVDAQVALIADWLGSTT
jgi:GntR family transcriptional repressor for pyruvate dehydrogenase complex